MEDGKITFDGVDFETHRELMLWTEKSLTELQEKFVITRDEKYSTKMFSYIYSYTISILKKKFASYVLNRADLKRRAFLVAEEIILQYYLKADFRVFASFGGYIEAKSKQIIFSGNYDLDSCANYTKIAHIIRDIKNNSVGSLEDNNYFMINTFRVFVSQYNEESGFWNDYKQIGEVEKNKEENDKNKRKKRYIRQLFSIDTDFEVVGYVNAKLRTYFVSVKNLDETKNKLKIEFREKKYVRGVSLDKDINISKTVKPKKVSLGNVLYALDESSEREIQDKNFYDCDSLEFIIKAINETEKDIFCPSKRINLHRLIVLRNRFKMGEAFADKFFNDYSKDSKIYYERILKLIYDVLKNKILKGDK